MTAPAAEPEKREFYRLRFPHSERPCLIIGRQQYEVVDCSARGLRFIITQQPLPSLGDLLEGRLQFRRHSQTPIRGLVVRIQHGEIALHMPDNEIPFTILRSEERYLLNHYRRWVK